MCFPELFGEEQARLAAQHIGHSYNTLPTEGLIRGKNVQFFLLYCPPPPKKTSVCPDTVKIMQNYFFNETNILPCSKWGSAKYCKTLVDINQDITEGKYHFSSQMFNHKLQQRG